MKRQRKQENDTRASSRHCEERDCNDALDDRKPLSLKEEEGQKKEETANGKDQIHGSVMVRRRRRRPTSGTVKEGKELPPGASQPGAYAQISFQRGTFPRTLPPTMSSTSSWRLPIAKKVMEVEEIWAMVVELTTEEAGGVVTVGEVIAEVWAMEVEGVLVGATGLLVEEET